MRLPCVLVRGQPPRQCDSIPKLCRWLEEARATSGTESFRLSIASTALTWPTTDYLEMGPHFYSAASRPSEFQCGGGDGCGIPDGARFPKPGGANLSALNSRSAP